jgi:hypothetical protein
MNKLFNRKRSGGPQTEQGKKSASRNALKTGAYSALIILPGESEEDFKALEAQFIHDFSPRDIAEAAMVRSLAVLTWKKLRVEKLEHAGLIRELNGPFDIADYLLLKVNFGGHDAEKILAVARLTKHDQLPHWKLAFQMAAKFQEHGATTNDIDALQVNCPLLYEFFRDEAHQAKSGKKPHHQWPSLILKNALGEEFKFIPYVAQKFLTQFKEQAWVVDHFDRVKATVIDIQEKRLLKFIQHHSAQRVYDDLDRAFYKTLGELRRHQLWRRDMSAYDVTPSENDRD